MKTIIATIIFLFASHAHAGTVTIQPGQCVQVGSTNVCASSGQVSSNNQPTIGQPYYPHGQFPPIVVEPVQELAPYAYCRLSENKAPNTWNLYRQGGTTKHRMNQLVKSFPHFEGSDCQDEADKINQRS